MTELNTRKCVPCEGGVAPLTAEEAGKLRAQLDPAWELASDGRSIRREYRFKDFYRTMSFVNALAHIANLEDHHPDLEVGYGYCRVVFTTHAIKGLSENDFICAAKIDRIPLS
jgi:4a-hydroxytetrahydrobiopterin dehydratase